MPDAEGRWSRTTLPTLTRTPCRRRSRSSASWPAEPALRVRGEPDRRRRARRAASAAPGILGLPARTPRRTRSSTSPSATPSPPATSRAVPSCGRRHTRPSRRAGSDAEGAELTVENLGCSGETTTSLLEGRDVRLRRGEPARAGRVAPEGPQGGGRPRDHRHRRQRPAAMRARRGRHRHRLRRLRASRPCRRTCRRSSSGCARRPATDVPVLVLGYYNPWVAAKALDQPVQGVDAAAKAYTRLSTAIEDCREGRRYDVRRPRRRVRDQRHHADDDQRPDRAGERRPRSARSPTSARPATSTSPTRARPPWPGCSRTPRRRPVSSAP